MMRVRFFCTYIIVSHYVYINIKLLIIVCNIYFLKGGTDKNSGGGSAWETPLRKRTPEEVSCKLLLICFTFQPLNFIHSKIVTFV